MVTWYAACWVCSSSRCPTTPGAREIVAKLNGAFNAALKSQPVIDYANKVKNNLYGGTPEAITELVNREVDVWAKLIKDAKLTID